MFYSHPQSKTLPQVQNIGISKIFKVFITFFHAFQFLLICKVLNFFVDCFLMNYAAPGTLSYLNMLTFYANACETSKNKFRKFRTPLNQIKKLGMFMVLYTWKVFFWTE